MSGARSSGPGIFQTEVTQWYRDECNATFYYFIEGYLVNIFVEMV